MGRDTNLRGNRQIDAARVFVDEEEKTALPDVDDIRVEGWTYQQPVDDLPASATPGMPWTSPFTVTPDKRTVTLSVQGREETYTVEEVEYYNQRGQLYQTYKKVVYLSKVRSEVHQKTITFEEASALPSYGNKVEEVETLTVYDYSGSNQINNEVVREVRTKWTYFSDNGDTRTMDKFEVTKAETGTSPLAVDKTVSTRQVFRRSLGQIWRETEIVEMDSAGLVSRSFEVSEIGPFKLTYSTGVPTASGKRMQSVTLASGGETAQVRFRSDLVADQASLDQLRTWLLDEYGSVRRYLRMHFAPKVDIRVANRLEVLNPPSDWAVASGIFVKSVRASRNGDQARMEIEGLTWAAA